jgi:hypothetical protein
MDERGRTLGVKVGPADLDRQGVGRCRGGRVVVVAAAREEYDEDEQELELST